MAPIIIDAEPPAEEEAQQNSASDALQQAERLLASAQTVEDIEQVREFFRWIHGGI